MPNKSFDSELYRRSFLALAKSGQLSVRAQEKAGHSENKSNLDYRYYLEKQFDKATRDIESI